MARKRRQQLTPSIDTIAVIGMLLANIAMGGFLVLGVTATDALAATPLLFIVAGVIFLLTLFTYLEGIAMLPQTGGASGFARIAFNELVSFMAAWALVLDYLIIVGGTAFFAVHYLASVPGLGLLLRQPAEAIATVVLIVLVAFANIRKLSIGVTFGAVLPAIAVLAQVLVVVMGMVMLLDPDVLAASITWGESPTWQQLAFALPIAMIGFTGLDVVANLSGELREPGAQLPRPAMYAAVVAVLLFVALGIIGLSAFPVEQTTSGAVTELGTTWVDRPVIGIVEALPLGEPLQSMFTTIIALIAAGVMLLAAQTGMGALGRIGYAMSLNRQMPTVLGRLGREAATPAGAVLIFAGLAIMLVLLAFALNSSALVLAQMYAFGAMFSMTVAGAAIIRLRFLEPDISRPYRAPLNIRIRGARVSLVSVVGVVLTAGMWVLVLATHDTARVVGVIWMVVGTVTYMGYRMTRGLSITRRATIRPASTVAISARVYDKILLPIRPERGRLWGAGDAELAALAHKLLDDGGQITTMLVHELPLTLPLDAPLGEVEQVTGERLSLLRKATAKFNVRLSSTVARSRAAGRAICQEAARRDVDAIVLAMRFKRRGGDITFGRTVSYVLRHAPCDVVVMSFPLDSLAPRSVKNSSRVEHSIESSQDTR
jgi:APA family basic amino acid/polyamine antiporter